MSKHQGETFTEQSVLLDGNEYVNCRFVNCAFIYGGGTPPTMTGNSVEGGNWTFVDAAANTIAFMSGLYRGGAKAIVEATLENIRGKPVSGGLIH